MHYFFSVLLVYFLSSSQTITCICNFYCFTPSVEHIFVYNIQLRTPLSFVYINIRLRSFKDVIY